MSIYALFLGSNFVQEFHPCKKFTFWNSEPMLSELSRMDRVLSRMDMVSTDVALSKSVLVKYNISLNEESSYLTEETSSVFFWMRLESSVMFFVITSISHLFWYLRAAFSSRISSMLLEEDTEPTSSVFFFWSSETSRHKRENIKITYFNLDFLLRISCPENEWI